MTGSEGAVAGSTLGGIGAGEIMPIRKDADAEPKSCESDLLQAGGLQNG